MALQLRIPGVTAPCALIGALMGALMGTPSYAEATQCDTRIDGAPVTIFFHADEATPPSLRQRFARRNETCAGDVVITYLTPDLTAEERAVFCANYDPETRSHSQPALGPRDSRGHCTEPSKTCEIVNTTRRAGMELAGLGETTGEGRLRSAVSAVTHASGAMVLSGNAGTLTGLLASTGAVLSTPVVMAGAAASLVVIGGVVYLCSDSD